MLSLKPNIKPHRSDRVLYAGSAIENAEYAMIAVHGRGASAESMLPLIETFNLNHCVYIMPQATNFTWYPYRFIEERQINDPGLTSGLTLLDSVVRALIEGGIYSDKIFIMGFSQGACLAADYVVRHPRHYAGAFILSGGLIGKTVRISDYDGDLAKTPVLLGCAEDDFHIPVDRVHKSATIFEGLNADVTKRIYPNLGHSINQDEIDIIKGIIQMEQIGFRI